MLFSALFLSFLLLNTTFISCAGGASGPKGSEAEGTALAIKLPDTAKTLYEKEAIVSFTVTVSSGSFNSTKSAGKGETMLFSNLPVGTYSVKAYGKTSRGAVAAKCETSVKVVAGETTTTTLHLARLEHWTVTFMNADDSELSTQDISDGYKATKPANPAPVSGKSFSGWTTDAEPSDTSPLFDFNTAITGDITLRPVFGVITYTVKYVSPVGSFTDASFTAATASSYSLPDTSSVTGVTFDNWYSDSAFSSSVDVASVRDITTFTKKDDIHYEKTIYAKWTAKVQFKGENVSTGTITTLSSNVIVTYGAKVSSPGNPTDPEGATFGGWYTGTYNESTGKVTFGSAYNFNSAVTEDITLYAKWNFVMHNVTYISAPYEDPNIPETEFREIQGLSYGDMYPGYGYLEELGLYFSGWTDDENYTWSTTPTTSIPANTTTDVTLYAMWYAQVSFGVTGYPDQNVLYGKGVTKPADPTNGTCEFIAWYKGTVDGEGNVTLDDEAYDFDDADVNKVTTSFTLYPKWRYTDFTGTAAEFLAAEFVPGNTAATKYNVTITSATASEIVSIGKAIGNSSDSNYKGVYIDLDLSGCGATSLGEYAFCATDYRAGTGINQYLVALTLPSTLTNISKGSLCDITWLSTIIIPSGVTSIGESAFKGCTNLTSITLPSNLTTIGASAFKNSGITGIRIPGGVTTISEYAFEDCTSLTIVIIENGVETIGYQAFKGCSGITTVSLPNSLTLIATGSFNGCSSLTSLTIPDSISVIVSNLFSGCSSLASVSIPASVSEIQVNAFGDCTNLSSVSVAGNDVWRGYSRQNSTVVPSEQNIPLTADKLKSGNIYRRQ